MGKCYIIKRDEKMGYWGENAILIIYDDPSVINKCYSDVF